MRTRRNNLKNNLQKIIHHKSLVVFSTQYVCPYVNNKMKTLRNLPPLPLPSVLIAFLILLEFLRFIQIKSFHHYHHHQSLRIGTSQHIDWWRLFVRKFVFVFKFRFLSIYSKFSFYFHFLYFHRKFIFTWNAGTWVTPRWLRRVTNRDAFTKCGEKNSHPSNHWTMEWFCTT